MATQDTDARTTTARQTTHDMYSHDFHSRVRVTVPSIGRTGRDFSGVEQADAAFMDFCADTVRKCTRTKDEAFADLKYALRYMCSYLGLVHKVPEAATATAEEAETHLRPQLMLVMALLSHELGPIFTLFSEANPEAACTSHPNSKPDKQFDDHVGRYLLTHNFDDIYLHILAFTLFVAGKARIDSSSMTKASAVILAEAYAKDHPNAKNIKQFVSMHRMTRLLMMASLVRKRDLLNSFHDPIKALLHPACTAMPGVGELFRISGAVFPQQLTFDTAAPDAPAAVHTPVVDLVPSRERSGVLVPAAVSGPTAMELSIKLIPWNLAKPTDKK